MKRFLGMALAAAVVMGMSFNCFAGEAEEGTEEKVTREYVQEYQEMLHEKYGLTVKDLSKWDDETVEWYLDFMKNEEEGWILRENSEPDLLTQVSNAFAEDEYSSLYQVDGVVHIIPVKNGLDLKKTVARFNAKARSGESVVIDEPKKYSYQELCEANDRLYDIMDELDLNSTSIKELENTLEVVLMLPNKWTEEKKQRVNEVAGIDNIIFTEKVPLNLEYDDNQFYPLSENKGVKSGTIAVGRAGSIAENRAVVDTMDNGIKSSIGVSVKGD